MIPKRILKMFLQFGSNKSYQRSLIVSEFSKPKSLEKHAIYLRKLFEGGYGLRAGNSLYAAWYSDEGIVCNFGDSAKYNQESEIVSWVQAAKIITDMLLNGDYTVQKEIDEAETIEYKDIAESLALQIRDAPSNFSFDTPIKISWTFPETVNNLIEIFKNPEELELLQNDMTRLLYEYQHNYNISNYYFHELKANVERLKELSMPKLTFKSSITSIFMPEMFITEDEINCIINKGSNVFDSKNRIYHFFINNTNNRVEFLKKEYGVGGSCPALVLRNSAELHNAKGIAIEKGNQKVLLSWSNVASRISELITTGHYIEAKIQEQAQCCFAEQEGGQLSLFI